MAGLHKRQVKMRIREIKGTNPGAGGGGGMHLNTGEKSYLKNATRLDTSQLTLFLALLCERVAELYLRCP